MTRRRGRARQRDQPCLDLTGDLRLDRWGETFPALDRRGDITATLGVCPGHVRDGVGIDADPSRNLPTTSRPSTTVIELQQDPRSTDLLRGMRTGPDHPGQPLTLIGAEHHRRQHRLRHDTSSWQGKEDCRDRSTASQPNVSGDTLLAGLPPVPGLYTALGALLLYPLIGSSRYLHVGPESSIAIVTAASIGGLAAAAPRRTAVLREQVLRLVDESTPPVREVVLNAEGIVDM